MSRAFLLRIVPVLLVPAGSHAAPEPAPTFNRDIAPLVHASCASCHRPGEAGPFPLLTHEDVSRKARTILRVLEDRSMPPWHATSGDFPFAHDRRLTEDQIRTFAAWTEAGTPRGDGPDPVPPSFPSGWTLGEPDLVLTMPAGFDVPAEGPDIYRNFALKLRLPEDRWVKAIELRPSARGVVHHSLFFLDTSGTALAEDGKDGRPGFRGMGFRRAGSLGGYVPGSTVQFLPDDYAMPLPKGADLVLSTHFHPSGKPETEQSTVGIYFADTPPSRTLTPVQVPPAFGAGMGIDIPAGESRYVVQDRFTLPVEADALSVGGHAHYLCVSQTLTARFPDGSSRLLLGIDDWDLDWQDRYFFAQPVRLPAGTVLEAELVYDNSAANPDNPFSPPRRVRWGHESTDEMGSVTLLLSPVPGAPESALAQAVRRSQASVLGAVLSRPRDAFALGLARRLQGLDADGDGRLQASELPRLHRDRALAFDRDADGALDDEEISALLESVRSGSDSPRT
jgi:mono/diheme cytochrome c family protein